MSISSDRVTTAEQLAQLPDDGFRYELWHGKLHKMMSPAGGRHGAIAARLLIIIGVHAKQHQLGVVFAAETGFIVRRNPDSVLAPDVAFVSWQRLGHLADSPGFLPLVPDLIAEVRSPGDSRSEIDDKMRLWPDAGVRTALLVDPQTTTVHEYGHQLGASLHADGRIDLGEVLPGLILDVVELFA